MTDDLQPWEPAEFKGTDLLPLEQEKRQFGPADLPVIEEHDLEHSDIKLPVLTVLQGTSKVVQAGDVEGAQPGKLYFSGTGKIIQPPARVLVIGRFRGNAMFVRNPDKNPEYQGLEDCISRDGVTGTKYGPCEVCERCTKWREGPDGSDLPPLGTKTQQFVVRTSDGIGMFRIALSNKWATNAVKDFMTRRTTTERNWFSHPTVIGTEMHENKDGEPYQTPTLRWQEDEIVPNDVQYACADWYRRVCEALEQGTLSEDEAGEAKNVSAPPPKQAAPSQDSDIPF